jgi:hypothetical protein
MEPIEAQRRSRSNGLRECLLTVLVFYSFAPGDASADDQPQSTAARRGADPQEFARTRITEPPLLAPFAFSEPRVETQVFSATEFRPRKPGLLEAAAARGETSIIDAPMLRDTSLAHELSEAKTQDRVRLLTLWQSRASSVYLQAGKRGSPSLQWSTPWMHRDVSARGLFDRLLPVSPRSFVSTVRGAATRQPGGAIPTAKALDLGTPVNSK